MKKTLAMLKPAIIAYMEQHYSPTESRRRWEQIELQSYHWLQVEGDLGGRRNMMASNMYLCYAMCAFYDAVDRKFSREDMEELVHTSMHKTFRMLNHLDFNRLEKKKWLMNILNRFLIRYAHKNNQKRGGDWGNTWDIRVDSNQKESGIVYQLNTCPLHEFAVKYGYTDILLYMCETDHLVAKQMHAHLIRHQRISDGDPCCAYRYVGDRSEAARRDPGSK